MTDKKTTTPPQQVNGALLIISGPSGCGKSTLTNEILKMPNVYFSISTTTRPKRDGEVDGVHYHFVDKEAFLAQVKEGKFLEWAQVHNNYYGTALEPIMNALDSGKLVIFDVDVQGHRDIKQYFGGSAKSVFITTKNKEILKNRLQKRQTDDAQTIEFRLMQAFNEMQHLQNFDYLIINDDIKSATQAIVSIATSLLYRNTNQNDELLKNWN
ncbi:guanylate kinase [Helicobacter sp. MIT 00-7814]|uniref:guanylate kinase n=1 Tax=unclassified Helicobacter TaxID=2593540 RepID=UPI000E1E3505|nr:MULTISPECIES: guanylate kinase [unclassified Helicobacter]RDU55853.1 guanylate kinase [Helicobacter sp. MIT 00-7814]RDU56811.1 guanylate kinase [Helicobacter sp. MIT 99-10781]